MSSDKQTLNPDKIHEDGIRLLSDDEYFSKVSFGGRVFDEVSHDPDNPNTPYHWAWNKRNGYIQDRLDFRESRWSIPFFEEYNEVTEEQRIQFNFGDLLRLPTRVLLRWEKHYLSAEVSIENIRTLLFPKTDADIRFITNYWKRRETEYEETTDLPWITKDDREKMAEMYTKYSKDKGYFVFKKQVLDRYRNNELCRLHEDYNPNCLLKFISNDRKHSASTIWYFDNLDGTITVRKEDWSAIPYKEWPYWEEFKIKDKEF